MVPSGYGSVPSRAGLDRYVVAQDGAQIVEVAFFVGDGDQPPVAVSGGNFDSEDRGAFVIGASRPKMSLQPPTLTAMMAAITKSGICFMDRPFI